MGAGLERSESSAEQIHSGCLSQSGTINDTCDNCVDELFSDPRSTLDNIDQFVDTTYGVMLHVWFDDAVARYWRFRETLWSGLSRPIYLLLSAFLE